MNDWPKRRRTALGSPHPNSPAGRMHDWSSGGVPHPDSPAGRIFDWSSSGIPHPNSPLGQNSATPWKMTLRQRFIEVLKLTPNHMAPELAAQFRAMLTPSTMAMIAITFTALAVSQAFGVGEVVDLILLVVGTIFVGMAMFTAAKDIVECAKTTVQARTPADLDRAAAYLAQAVAILGVVVFFELVAKVGEKFGGATSAGEEGSAAEKPTVKSSEELPQKEPPAPRKAPPRQEITDPIAERQAANQALRESPQFEKDLNKANISEQQLQWMNNKQAPLGFENPEQFQTFKQELSQALQKDGLNDAEVGMKGTATTFYSENPSKPVGHFWDADPNHPGDYDLNLSSDKMAQQMGNAGIDPSPKYGVFRTADINSQFPAVSDFSAKWSGILGRDVNVVGYPAEVVPVRDPTEFILVK
jgi:hypothetical protein